MGCRWDNNLFILYKFYVKRVERHSYVLDSRQLVTLIVCLSCISFSQRIVFWTASVTNPGPRRMAWDRDRAIILSRRVTVCRLYQEERPIGEFEGRKLKPRGTALRGPGRIASEMPINGRFDNAVTLT